MAQHARYIKQLTLHHWSTVQMTCDSIRLGEQGVSSMAMLPIFSFITRKQSIHRTIHT